MNFYQHDGFLFEKFFIRLFHLDGFYSNIFYRNILIISLCFGFKTAVEDKEWLY